MRNPDAKGGSLTPGLYSAYIADSLCRRVKYSRLPGKNPTLATARAEISTGLSGVDAEKMTIAGCADSQHREKGGKPDPNKSLILKLNHNARAGWRYARI